MSAPDIARWADGRQLEDPEEEGPDTTGLEGVFETLRCEDGRLGFPAAHLARMEKGARALSLAWPPPWDPARTLADFAGSVPHGILAVRLTWTPPHLTLVARAVMTRPAAPMGWLAAPGAAAPPEPHGVKATRRDAYEALRAQAAEAGAFEALVRDRMGRLVEGTWSNVFAVLGGRLVTPPLQRGGLPGIVRGVLLADLARHPLQVGASAARPPEELDLEENDLMRADEVLLTSSVQRVVALADLQTPEGLSLALPGGQGPFARALGERVAELEAASAAGR